MKESNVEVLQKVLQLLESGHPKKALETLEGATFVQEFDLMKRQIQAEILATLQENNRAECAYLSIIRQYPESHDTKFALSQLYQNSGRFSQALDFLNQVIEANPDHFMAYNNKGNVLKSLKKNDEAVQCYKKSLSINTGYSLALTNLCLILSEQDELDEALKYGHQALESAPTSVTAYALVHEIYKKQEQTQKAQQIIEQGLENCGEDQRLVSLKDAS
jgi:tetratricopeptide (TPR) repeat protein